MKFEKEIRAFRTHELEFKKQIVDKHLAAWVKGIDEKILPVVRLLMVHGFQTITSCEGYHMAPTNVDTFRFFWPYVEINLSHEMVFDLKEARVVTQNPKNRFEMFRQLKNMLMLFNGIRHPFYEDRLELDIRMPDPISVYQTLENGWNLNVFIADKSVAGIDIMPQEFLTDSFRAKFLTRTQHQMELFGEFLEWYAVEKYIKEDEKE